MQDLTARMMLREGPALLNARAGRYDIDQQRMIVDGLVRFTAADGYRMTASNVSINLAAQTVEGAGRVEGAVPAGTFAADSIRADLEARTLTLAGNARLRMVPGLMRMP
jgi:lipopolysaccharide export system protein LptC